MFAVLLLLIVGSEIKAQGFGGVYLANELVSNAPQLLLGGGGAWLVNEKIYLGGAGYGSLNTVALQGIDNYRIGYGGFMAGYIHPSNKKTTFAAELLIGSGGYDWETTDYSFFLLQPEVKLWHNFNPYVFGSIGLYYRIAYTNTNEPLNSNDLSRIGLKLAINFGSLKNN